MSSSFGGWFGYGFGVAAGRELFGGDRPKPDAGPIRQKTEEEIRADEKRFDEEAKRLQESEGGATK